MFQANGSVAQKVSGEGAFHLCKDIHPCGWLSLGYGYIQPHGWM